MGIGDLFAILAIITAIAIGLISALISSDKNENREKGNGKNANTIIKFNKRKIVVKKILNKLTKQQKIILCFILLTGSVIIAIISLYLVWRPYEYKNEIIRASFEYDRHNFMEAAKYYDNAIYLAYDIETKAFALYCEGSCYFSAGLDTKDKNYFSQALEIYYSILNNEKYKKVEYYQDALADVSFILRELYGDLNDKNLVKIISEIEDTYDFTNLDNLTVEEIDLINKSALFLAIYYRNKADESYEFQDKPKIREYSHKALFYYNVVCKLTPKADQIHFGNTNLFYFYMEMSDLMVKGSLSCDNYNDSWNSLYITIKFCESIVNAYELLEIDSDMLSSYLQIKINLGKAYFFFSELESEEYLSKAYDELSPLLYLNVREDTEEVLLDAGYYIVLTKKCTDEEIEIVLTGYERQLEKMTVEDENYLKILRSAITTCNNIVNIYGQNKYALELRKELSEKLYSIQNL